MGTLIYMQEIFEWFYGRKILYPHLFRAVIQDYIQMNGEKMSRIKLVKSDIKSEDT